MSYRLIIRNEAEIEITDAAVWYQNQQARLGDEFLAEIQIALERAASNPRQYPRFRRKPEVRRALVGRFPYRIFFVVRPEAIVVFRVLQ
jgi:plasmid stabilization system protein ParE